MKSRTITAAIVALMLLAAACSSTATSDKVAADKRGRAAADGTDLTEAIDGVTGEPGSTDAGGSTTRRSGSRARVGGGTGGGSGGGSGGGGSSNPAVTGGKVQIGIHLSENGQAASEFGVARLPVSGRQEVEAVVKWINANGGMGGKEVEPVFHTSDPLAAPFDALAESACRNFTEDHKVFAVVDDALVPSRNMAACLARHNTPLVWTYEILLTQEFMNQYADYLYMPQAIEWQRFGVHIDHLASQGYFEGGKVGLVRYDNGTQEAYARQVIEPALKRNGIPLADEGVVSEPKSAGEAGAVSGQASNIILRFRQAGVNRVLFVPTGAALPLLFMAAAEGQGYRPRYGLTSFDPPGFLAANFGPSQLSGSVVTAWLPTGDLPTEIDHTKYVPAARRCDDAVKAGGFQSGGPIVAYCEGLFLLKDALDRDPTFTVPGFRKTIEAFGTSFADPRTFGSRFGPGRHDGATQVTTALYDAGCGCYQYTGGKMTAP